MARICPLFSGSTGNSTYILSNNSGILVDAGASCKSLIEAIASASSDVSEIKAVLITHEHTDHIKGLKTFLNKTGVPLFASSETLAALEKLNLIPPKTSVFEFDGSQKEIAGMCVERFATSHDCKGSSGYTFTLSDGKKIGVCTDLGIVTDEVHKALCGCTAVLLESNYDVEMLKRGPYPAQLKLRIMSDNGHLANNASADEIKRLMAGGTTRFILGHLSRNNNLPAKALSCTRAALSDLGAECGRDYLLSAASPSGSEAIPI